MSFKVNEIEVIHLATGSVGGAGLAARRLNKALNEAGFDSKFYSPTRGNYFPSKNEYELPRSTYSKVKSGISTFAQKKFNQFSFFSLFSADTISLRTLKKISDKEKTILQFHNWFNLVSQKTILKLAISGYKVVLTMHDERFFTGGCHYSLECRKFTEGCNNCPRLNWPLYKIPNINIRTTQKLIQEARENLFFISPSKWINNEAKQSLLLANANLFHIPNTLAENLTKLSKPRRRLNPGHLNIGIASMDHKSFVKGGDTLLKVEKLIRTSALPINFLYLNQIKIESEQEEKFWGKIDYLLLLSRADNSPNVIHEAKFRGIPIISTATGGITELLSSPPDVAMPMDITPDEILKKLELLLNPDEIQEDKDLGNHFYDYVVNSISDHISLYKNIKTV